MPYDYFHYTQFDKAYYDAHLKGRMPKRFIDSHTHMNLPEHLVDVPPERIANDWALQNGMRMTAEDAALYYNTLFPDQEWELTSFPFPIKEAHLEENNDYIAKCAMDGKIRYALMCTKPTYSCEYIAKEYEEKGFSGLKPYPDLVSGQKGAEIGIFQFLPHEQLVLAEKAHMPIVMHLPRAGRMPDDGNIRELREIRQKYPDLVMVIAHFGRCYTPYHFNQALDKLGDDVSGFWFDTAAVTNPAVLDIALERLDTRRILFGTDEPIFLWHGYRHWTETSYINLAQEDFPWNTHRQEALAQEHTLFVYRQIDNILTALERAGFGEDVKDDIFYHNCVRVFGEKRGALR